MGCSWSECKFLLIPISDLLYVYRNTKTAILSLLKGGNILLCQKILEKLLGAIRKHKEEGSRFPEEVEDRTTDWTWSLAVSGIPPAGTKRILSKQLWSQGYFESTGKKSWRWCHKVEV